MAFSWRITVFQKSVLWNPYFYSVLGGARILGRVVQNIFLTEQLKHRNCWLITENFLGGVFWFFFLFCCPCFFCFFLFSFVTFLNLKKPQKTVFPFEKRAVLLNFQCLPFFLLRILPPLFLFLCLSLSLSLYLSLSLSLALFVFPSLFVVFFVSLFCLFLYFSSLLCFVHEKKNIRKITLDVFFPRQCFLFCWCSVLFFFQIPLPYLCFFPVF